MKTTFFAPLFQTQKMRLLVWLPLLVLFTIKLPAQVPAKRLTNPILSMRDGAVERFMGGYYAIGEATNGKIYYSKDLIKWSAPVLAVTTNLATWLDDPQWAQASVYKNILAGDLIYRNGVFHTYWNGIGHAYASTPLGPYVESSINEPFDDYGIDTEVFQDEDGEIYWVKKRNPADPHPMTGAPSNIDGPEVWVFKMNSPFARKDITTASVQLTHQRGHPTSVNHVNFEGPELFKYRGRYYIFYASNRMGPRSGMYEIGVAESDLPMNFNNTKKYPHPILARNTEQHLLDYNIILNSAEHGGWDCKCTTTTPTTDWINASFDDTSWATTQGGFGRQEYDLYSGTTYTNAKIRPRKTVWNTSKIYIRRKFTLTEVPTKLTLKHWVYGNANFYINGNKLNVNASNNTYSHVSLNPSWFVVGENTIAVEVTSPCSDQYCQQFIDFGLYDTGANDAEDVVIGPAQPNFVVGPNGFERWLMYKAYFSNNQVQGIDRIHFYNKEVVAESSTVKNTLGYRPKPALPSMINYFDSPNDAPFDFCNHDRWKISNGILSPEKEMGGELLLNQESACNYRFEVPFRILQNDAWAGAYAYFLDVNNWLKISIGRNKTWKSELCVNGETQVTTQNLPTKFAFLENNPLVSTYDEPWHTLVIYKNAGKFKIELDYFNLTLAGEIQTPFNHVGRVGLTASSSQVSFDAIQFTAGWDEYDTFISGWENAAGTWTVNSNGMMQSATVGKAETFKGDAAWNYEFSVYMKNNQLPNSGAGGFYPLYVDNQNYVKATINYANKTLDIEQLENGNETAKQSISLKKRIIRQYTYSSYPTTSYRYDLRNESLISGVNILWFEGNYPYLNQTFDLPQTVKFYALQNGSWMPVNAQLEGTLKFSSMNHFTFPATKATAIRMDVTNYSGKASRAYSVYFDEEVSAGYFLRCRREEDGLHLFVDDAYETVVQGNWDKSRVGLYTENMSATFNGMLHYQSGGVAVNSITIAPVVCNVGETVKLNTQISPANATNTLLKWESSDSTIVRVSANGTINRLKQGDVKITATTCDGGIVTGTLDLIGTSLKHITEVSFNVYPNPAKKELFYSLSVPANDIAVYSITGEKLMAFQTMQTNKLSIDNLSAGIYLLVAKTENHTLTKRFTVLGN